MDRAKRLFAQLTPQAISAAANVAPEDARAAPAAALYSAFRLEPLTPHTGAEIFDLDCKRVIERDPEALRQVHDAFTRYKVVMFRETKMDRDGQMKFVASLTNFWGLDVPQNDQQRQTFQDGLFIHPFLPQPKGYPNVWVVDARLSNGWGRFEQGVEEQANDYFRYQGRTGEAMREGGTHGHGRRPPKGNIFGPANLWHSDNGFLDQPSSVSTLRAVKVPPVGGDTCFANMELAYEDLDEAMKAKLAQCISVSGPHGSITDWQRAANRFGDEETKARVKWLEDTFGWEPPDGSPAARPLPRYPVVRTHPVTGNKSIFVNAGFTNRIEGPCVEDEGGSVKFLQKLYSLAQVPEYQCRFRWKNETDMIMWDNRCLVHYAVADHGGENGGPRWMDHVATLGTTPV